MPIRVCRIIVAVIVGLLCAESLAAPAPRPNIVFILVDDLGYGDIACYGHPQIKTPSIDALAAQGVRFTSFYASAPECSPTRTALLTGRYPQRVGGLECAIGFGNVGRYDDAIRLAEAHELGLPAHENVLIPALRQAGYAPVIFGKWHLGYERKFWPLNHGFEQFFGPLGGGVDYYHHSEPDGPPMLARNDAFIQRDGYLTDLITDEAIAFLKAHDAVKPFFLYLPYTAPHTPIQAPDAKPARPRSLAEFNDGTPEDYRAMIERLDQCIGRLLAELDRRGLRDNTLVIFTSDNGATKLGRNAPFSGQKGGLFEGGIRVPCIVRWPGILPPGATTDRVAITMDLTASLLRIAAAKPRPDRPTDGIDILDALQHGRPETPRTLFWRQRRGDVTWRAVRDGSMKYISRQTATKLEEHLFNLANDPAEAANLTSSRPDDLLRLRTLLAAWEQQVRPPRPAQ